jgi:hypothetical protein
MGTVISKALHGLAPRRNSKMYQSPQKLLADTCSALYTLRQVSTRMPAWAASVKGLKCLAPHAHFVYSCRCTFSELLRGIGGAGALLALPVAAPLVIFLLTPRVEVREGGGGAPTPAPASASSTIRPVRHTCPPTTGKLANGTKRYQVGGSTRQGARTPVALSMHPQRG